MLFFQSSTFTQGFGDGVTNKRLCFDTVWGVGLITLSMVFNSVGLPIEGIALIMGIDRILDMARTAVNITGDAVCTTIVASQDKAVNRQVFYRKK